VKVNQESPFRFIKGAIWKRVMLFFLYGIFKNLKWFYTKPQVILHKTSSDFYQNLKWFFWVRLKCGKSAFKESEN